MRRSILGITVLVLFSPTVSLACSVEETTAGLSDETIAELQRRYGPPRMTEPDVLRASGGDECPDVLGHGLAGMGSIAELFMELERFDPRYRAAWEGALTWVENDAQPGNPGLKWEAIYCDARVRKKLRAPCAK